MCFPDSRVGASTTAGKKEEEMKKKSERLLDERWGKALKNIVRKQRLRV